MVFGASLEMLFWPEMSSFLLRDATTKLWMDVVCKNLKHEKSDMF